MKKEGFKISNIIMDTHKYNVNEFICLIKISEAEIIVEFNSLNIEHDKYLSNGALFYHALQIALPEFKIQVMKPDASYETTYYNLFRGWNTPFINYYSSKDEDMDVKLPNITIDSNTIKKIKQVFELVVDNAKAQNQLREESKWSPTRWQYAYNCYIECCTSSTVEMAIQFIMSGMEALLVQGDGSITYRVALNASIVVSNQYEERVELFKLIKNAYNIRSKATHGEISSLVKLLRKEKVYENLFQLKSVFSRLLIKSYGKGEEEFFDEIASILFNSPAFNIN